MFQVGNVVCLHSGGPLMTISKVDLLAEVNPGYVVSWFDLKGKLKHGKVIDGTVFRVQKSEASNSETLVEQQVQ